VTEAEWLASADPLAMLRFLGTGASQRKLRLFAHACFRRLAFLLPDERQRWAIEVLAGLADGTLGTPSRSVAAAEARLALPPDTLPGEGEDHPHFVALMLYREFMSTSPGLHAAHATAGLRDGTVEATAQCRMLRDIVGNPFRPSTCAPEWRTPTVVSLAEATYADNEFDRLPILADALEDAGCDDAAILAHLRDPSQHVRGCWALDLLLGKE